MPSQPLLRVRFQYRRHRLVLDVGAAGRTWFKALFPSGVVVATTPVGGRPVIASCLASMLLGSSRRLSAAASHDRLALVR